VEDFDALKLFLDEVSRFPLLSAEDEIALAKLIERGDKGAKDRMINSNLRLVVSIARRYKTQQLGLLDVIQEGILGLIRATEKFDWRRGHKFSTYAVWWIREAIERGIANRARLIRMPVYMVERERKVRHLERTLTAELGRAPSDDEIALAAKLPLRRVQEVREAARHVTSLDLPVGEGEEASLGDLLVSDQRQPPEEVELRLRQESLRAALSKLPANEREVVELRFGIDHEPNTVEQVMNRLHLSRDRVRRIESRALARLRGTPELQALRGA
jgi:RNA polymerase primary sigma factor